MLIERLIHSLKTALAFGLGYSLTRLITLPSDQWVIITIAVIMCAQLYVGSVLQKSLLRFLGTIAGCLFAIACLQFMGTQPLAIGAALIISGFCFSFIATSQENYAYAGTLGAVTVPIILLGPEPSLFFAASRFLEISLGLLIATLISQFVLPIHARKYLKRTQVFTLEQIANYYRETIMGKGKGNELSHEKHDEAIVKLLLKQRTLAKESSREPLGKRFNPEHFSQCLYYEREILRAINFMQLAKLHLNDHPVFSSDTLKVFHESVLNALALLARSLRSSQTPNSLPALNIHDLAELLAPLKTNPNDALYLDGYLFSAEALITNIKRLASLQG